MTSNSTREKGGLGESFAAKILTEMGLHIEERNYTIKGGEVDIIATDDDEIAFIEVKTRRKNSMISGMDAVTNAKQKRIIKAAKSYLEKNTPEYYPRFDVFEITIAENGEFKVLSYDYIKSAFWEK
ncbi:MAG: YraN family protein [Oscillospiraceae bacterium]